MKRVMTHEEGFLSGEILRSLLVSNQTSLHEGLQRMNDTGLQILLVTDGDDHLVGLLTDGDVRRALLKGLSMDEPVDRIMNRSFSSLRQDEAHLAQDFMRRSGKVSQLPILDRKGRVTDLAIRVGRLPAEAEKPGVPVVVMAGGEGTRLSPLTRIVPKPLIPVGEQTMLEKILDTFSSHGFRDFRIIVNYKKELIKSYVSEAKVPHRIQFVDEEVYLGTGGGLSLLRGCLRGTFLLTNRDIIADLDYGRLLEWHRKHEAHLTILGVRRRIEVPYGVIHTNESSLVTHMEEKPCYHHIISGGIYVAESSILELIPKRESVGMDDLIQRLTDRKMKITCYPVANGWFDMGQFQEYRNLLAHFGEPNG